MRTLQVLTKDRDSDNDWDMLCVLSVRN